MCEIGQPPGWPMIIRPQSVFASDHDVLAALFAAHVVPSFPEPRVLDCTFGRGVLWRGLPWRPHRMDLNADLDLDTVGDNRQLAALFAPRSFDALLYDPRIPATSATGCSANGTAAVPLVLAVRT